MNPPDQCASLEDYLRAHNHDLTGLSPSELESEAFWAAQIARRDPRRLIWRGPCEFVSVREWADERIQLAWARLAPPARAPRRSERVRSWLP